MGLTLPPFSSFYIPARLPAVVAARPCSNVSSERTQRIFFLRETRRRGCLPLSPGNAIEKSTEAENPREKRSRLTSANIRARARALRSPRLAEQKAAKRFSTFADFRI
jgi:hypothetical protein